VIGPHTSTLDDGELEAIPLVEELAAAFLLIDEVDGREEAPRHPRHG
jgi:predicted nucleic acid-binding protein